MKVLISGAAAKLRKRHPVVLTGMAVVYELALGMLDLSTPEDMSFVIFYLLGVAFAAWGVGSRAAALVSAVSATTLAVHELVFFGYPRLGYAMMFWNVSTRFCLFCFAGWLVAEVTRLNRHLQNLVASRTSELHAEIQKHRSTADQRNEALSRLRAIIAGTPLVIFAVDRNGTILFEDGRALNELGVQPGDHVGQNVIQAYRQSKELPEHMRRALAGEEFSSLVQIGSLAFETWYTPSRDAEGLVRGYTGVAMNVTKQRKLERQILEISDREQARIGQEIHDGLCQQLVSLAFDANSLKDALTARKLPETRIADRMAHLLDQAITEARQLARGLFPIRLDAQGLGSALEELARTARERFGIACEVQSKGGLMIESKAMATHLYRIAQEAVTNAVKHGAPRSITVRLQNTPDQIKLEVRDDGVGLPPAVLRESEGMGLHIMDYRARSLGGNISFGSAPQGGTIVSCCVPKPVA